MQSIIRDERMVKCSDCAGCKSTLLACLTVEHNQSYTLLHKALNHAHGTSLNKSMNMKSLGEMVSYLVFQIIALACSDSETLLQTVRHV